MNLDSGLCGVVEGDLECRGVCSRTIAGVIVQTSDKIVRKGVSVVFRKQILLSIILAFSLFFFSLCVCASDRECQRSGGPEEVQSHSFSFDLQQLFIDDIKSF